MPEGVEASSSCVVVHVPYVEDLPFYRSLIVTRKGDEDRVLILGLDQLLFDPSVSHILKDLGEISDSVKIHRTLKRAASLSSCAAPYFPASELVILAEVTLPGVGDPMRVVAGKLQQLRMPLPRRSLAYEVVRLQQRREYYSDNARMAERLDRLIARHEKEVSQKQKHQGPIVDEEGFTLVTAKKASTPDGTVVKSFKAKNTMIPGGSTRMNQFLRFSNLTPSRQGAESEASGITSEPIDGPSRDRKRGRKGGQEGNFYRFQKKELRLREVMRDKEAEESNREILKQIKRQKRFRAT